MRTGVLALVLLGLLPATSRGAALDDPAERLSEPVDVFAGPIGRASCGLGSSPETGIQGQVPAADRASGRSAEGYSCNLERVGQWQGPGATYVNPSYGRCAYMGTKSQSRMGVQVVDVADPARPVRTAQLQSPGMLGTWETLRVDEERGLLVGAFAGGPGGSGLGALDVYDIAGDCAKPKLLNSIADGLSAPQATSSAHEGGFSPDGRTYWLAAGYDGQLTAVDLADPARPRTLGVFRTSAGNHGFGFSADGRRMYVALQSTDPVRPNGLQVLDVSEVRDREPGAQVREVGRVTWPVSDGANGQMAAPVTYDGRPYVVFVDESSQGSARIIDVLDEERPRVVSKLRLEIQMPDKEALRNQDDGADGLFNYDAHYCTPDRRVDPTALACGMFQSGVRVFDIRDPRKPREIAYFNPPAQVGKGAAELPGSEHAGDPTADRRTDFCTSPPRFVRAELWVTCQDNGFQVLRFTNGAYPIAEAAPAAAPRTCVSRRVLTVRVPRRLRGARATFAGQTLAVRSGRVRIDLRGRPRGTYRLTITGRTPSGRPSKTTRRYRTCA